ncbi:hypothetical protein DACRYDRAFT_14644 [Dacryopinax primogenitus]|uniref:Mediator of RNA polymerase II transcription subunit 4 n=1 Tax=Dacryopinax primogenitus (strain DJM 731) TaxID=1858805 RepID=M5GES7_DACPD|nr:uncharacterized protein DACRYDRAFT_14644 [Dacryopinax primogenitus]EJU03548.1 hypothetical protein DACRYDRAFT_14644 [Dacryopinax primogenitus]
MDDEMPTLPMRDSLLQQLDILTDLSFSLFSSLASSSTSTANVDAAPFLQVEKRTAAFLRWARVHQLRWRKIERLREEVKSLEKELGEALGALERAGSGLGEMLREGEGEEADIRNAEDNPIPYEELIYYAQHLAGFTSLPPSFPPYRLSADASTEDKPPFNMHVPTTEMLRRGRLSALGGEAMSLWGTSGEVGVAPDHPQLPDAQAEAHSHAQGPTAPIAGRQAHRPAAAEVFNDLDLNLDL